MNQANTPAIANSIVSLCTNLPSTLLTMCATQITASASPQTVTPTVMTGITQGVQLLVDLANPETITVASVSGGSFTAVFGKNHSGIWTIGQGPLFYSFVKLGAVQDPTDITTYAAVTLLKRKTERYDSGWQVHSKPIFQVETGANMQSDSTSSEQIIMKASDLLSFLLVHRYQLNAAPGVYITLTDMDDSAGYKEYINTGRIYRIVLCYFECVQQYQVQLAP